MAVERVQVGDEQVDVALLVGGEAGQGPDRAGVVAEVQLAGRLEARQRRDAAVGGGRVRGHGDLLVVRAPGVEERGVGGHRGRAVAGPVGGRAGAAAGSQYTVWIGLPASGRPTTTSRAARAAPGRRRCCCAAARSWCINDTASGDTRPRARSGIEPGVRSHDGRRPARVRDHLPDLRAPSARADAGERLPGLLCLHRLRRASAAGAGRLLRVLLVRRYAVPAEAARSLNGATALPGVRGVRTSRLARAARRRARARRCVLRPVRP